MGNPKWYKRLDPHWLTDAEWIESRQGRPPLSDAECIARSAVVDDQFSKHKFREGEYYDRYLTKLLDKNGLDLDEYYWGLELRGREEARV